MQDWKLTDLGHGYPYGLRYQIDTIEQHPTDTTRAASVLVATCSSKEYAEHHRRATHRSRRGQHMAPLEPKDRQPSRWERLRILDSQMKMAQATANQPAYLKALANYRRLKQPQCFNGCDAPTVTTIEGQPVCDDCAGHYLREKQSVR